MRLNQFIALSAILTAIASPTFAAEEAKKDTVTLPSTASAAETAEKPTSAGASTPANDNTVIFKKGGTSIELYGTVDVGYEKFTSIK